jgi:hypothetical protein
MVQRRRLIATLRWIVERLVTVAIAVPIQLAALLVWAIVVGRLQDAVAGVLGHPVLDPDDEFTTRVTLRAAPSNKAHNLLAASGAAVLDWGVELPPWRPLGATSGAAG